MDRRPERRRPRALLALVAAGFCLAAAAPAQALPPQGMYEGCAPGTTEATVDVCNERLQTMRAAGITIVLNYSALYGDVQRIREYAAEAQRLGMQMIWPLHHPNLRRTDDVRSTYPDLTAECGCSSPADFIRFAVGVLRDLPATYAYYVGDEVPLGEHDALKAVSDLVHQADPTHPRFYVSIELYDYGANLAPFADVAEILAGDDYPIGRSGEGPANVGAAMAGVQRVADRAGKPAAIVLQSFSWESDGFVGSPWPTREQYHAMLEQALANGRPRFVMWWAYYKIAANLNAAALWADFTAGVFGDGTQGSTVAPANQLRVERAAGTRSALSYATRRARARALARRCARRRGTEASDCRRRASAIRTGRPSVSFTADGQGTVLIAVSRGGRRLISATADAVTGPNRWRMPAAAYRRLAPGAYRVTVTTPVSTAAARLRLR